MMEHVKNGQSAPYAVQFHARTLSDGTVIIRYFTSGKYLGEVQLWAVDQRAAAIIAKDLYTKTSGVMVVGQ